MISGAAPADGAPAARRPWWRAALALARWPNILIAIVGVLVGAWWAARGALLLPALGWAVLSATFATAAINAVNDVFDVDIDRRAHPDRPLVRGELSLDGGRTVALVAFVLAAVTARLASPDVLSLVTAALLVGFAYSPWLKPRGLLGNVAVAVVGAFPFLVGAAAVADAAAALPLFAVAVPLHFAREVVKDVADAAGDASRRRTLVLVAGERAARAVALAGVAAHAGLVTFLFAPAGSRRLVLLPSAALAAWAVVAMPAARAATVLKLAMLLAMSALLLL